MAEEQREGRQSMWMLLVSLGIGLLVVLIYTWHIGQVRREGKGQAVRLLRVKRDMAAGDRINKDRDLEEVEVDARAGSHLGDVVDALNKDNVNGDRVNRDIEKGRWLLWSHVTRSDTEQPAALVEKGMVTVTVPLDQNRSPGAILRPNDRVNVLGLLSLPGRPPQTYRIIEGVRVLAVGGLGPEETAPGRARSGSGQRSYRSITIEVSPPVSIQLANVLTHVGGGCWLELRSAKDAGDPKARDPQVNPELRALPALPGGAKTYLTSAPARVGGPEAPGK